LNTLTRELQGKDKPSQMSGGIKGFLI